MNKLEKLLFFEKLWFKKNIKSLGYIIVNGGYFAYKKPKKVFNILIESLHGFAKKPFLNLAEKNTAQIAHLISDKLRCGILISLKPRFEVDLSKSKNAKSTKLIYPINQQEQVKAKTKYHHVVKRIFDKITLNGLLEKKALILSLHGMKRSKFTDIDLGTANGKKCERGMAEFLREEILKEAYIRGLTINVTIDELFSNSWGTFILNKRSFLGKKLNYLQIEVSEKLRTEHPEDLAEIISAALLKFSNYNDKKENIPVNNSTKSQYSIYVVDDGSTIEAPKIYLSFVQRKKLGVKIKDNIVLKDFSGISFAVHNCIREELGSNRIGFSAVFITEKRIKLSKKFTL